MHAFDIHTYRQTDGHTDRDIGSKSSPLTRTDKRTEGILVAIIAVKEML